MNDDLQTNDFFDCSDDENQDSEEPDDVIILHMDIREPLKKLRKLLEDKVGFYLNGYKFWLQDTQELEPHKNLVDQCVKGEGLVQINVQIQTINHRINIIDVLKPTEAALGNRQQPAVNNYYYASPPIPVQSSTVQSSPVSQEDVVASVYEQNLDTLIAYDNELKEEIKALREKIRDRNRNQTQMVVQPQFYPPAQMLPYQFYPPAQIQPYQFYPPAQMQPYQFYPPAQMQPYQFYPPAQIQPNQFYPPAQMQQVQPQQQSNEEQQTNKQQQSNEKNQ